MKKTVFMLTAVALMILEQVAVIVPLKQMDQKIAKRKQKVR